MNKNDQCPSCDGFGRVFGAFHPIIVDCAMCEGRGWIPDIKKIWIEQGVVLKKYRIEVLNISLREACREFDFDPSNLSKMERGVIKPKTPKEIYSNATP